MNRDDLEAKLEFRIGTNLLREFAAGHNAADVLRELVHNEYDAGGSRLLAEFGLTEMIITGNGAAIDPAGWRRLSVMLSTGNVAGGGGSSVAIEPKVNGIGSKNLGLRTLFLFGDRIEIRSGGLMTLTDLRCGAVRSVDATTHLNPPGVTGPRPRAAESAQLCHRSTS